MELIQPWKTVIAKINLADVIHLEALANEIMSLHSISPAESETAYKVTPEEFPYLCEVRDNIITPLVQTYVKESMDFDLTKFTVDTFGKWFPAGSDLAPHTHGSTGITTVFYPADYRSSMMVYDPRNNASRGYPRKIRDNYFAPYTIYPKAGDLIIMPSYLQHYVPTVEDDLRLSLINDYMFATV